MLPPPKDGVDEGQKVAFETFSRAVDEKKRFQSENESLKEKLASLEAQEAEKNGNTQQALDSWKERATKAEEALKTTKKTIAQEKVESHVISSLREAGCKKPEAALKIMDDKDYQTLFTDVGDNFIVGDQTLNYVIDKLKRETKEIGLFGQAAPKVIDGTPLNGGESKPKSAKEVALNKLKNAKDGPEYEQALEEAMKYFD